MSEKETYVSAAKVISYINKTSSKVSATIFKKYVNGIIAEDVMTVVRCKDCKHYRNRMCDHMDGLCEPLRDDYCSYGERKETT